MKKILALLLAFCMMAAFTACDGSNELEKIDPYPVTVGQTTIAQSPLAVASLSPSITNLLIELGYEDRIVGYSSEEILPTLSEDDPRKIGAIGTALEPDFEAIGALAPEIIFTTRPMVKADLDRLTGVGIKVCVLPVSGSVEGLKARCVELIRAMEGERKARTVGAELVERIGTEINGVTSKLTAGKRTLLYIASLYPLVATPDTYEWDLLSLVSDNVVTAGKNYTLSAEEIAALDPDIILYSAQIGAEELKASEIFGAIPAVQSGRMLAVNEDTLCKQTIVVADTVRAIAEKLYPNMDFTLAEEEE